ncbi:MAG: hypothetical protein MR936_00620, partial [Eubacterium sp.]|nr:hypothetical protein [Eubacterium sp.]
FLPICIIIEFVKRIYPSKIFFTINNPLLIIYTPLEIPVAPLPGFLFAFLYQSGSSPKGFIYHRKFKRLSYDIKKRFHTPKMQNQGMETFDCTIQTALIHW